MATISAVIAGAGSGTRLGANMPKALVPLNGEALIVHAVRGMNAAGIDDIVITIPPDHEADFAEALKSAGLAARLVAGGATRQGSVANGLAAISSDLVLVHDAARALTPPEAIIRVVEALRAGHRAVVPALPVTDTIKEVSAPEVLARADSAPQDLARADSVPQVLARADSATEVLARTDSATEVSARADSATEVSASDVAEPSADERSPAPGAVVVEPVVGTLDRSSLRAMQTPQGFGVALLRQAHEAGAKLSEDEQSAAPDDAALVELLGEPVVLVAGSQEALKVTTPFDLQVAELIAHQRAESSAGQTAEPIARRAAEASDRQESEPSTPQAADSVARQEVEPSSHLKADSVVRQTTGSNARRERS